MKAGQTPEYWDSAIQHLTSKDTVLASVIGQYKGESLTSRGDLFFTLIRSIVGQQISVKAAATVWQRLFDEVGGDITPERLACMSVDDLRGCGLSRPKTNYIRGIAEKFAGEFADLRWGDMDDAVIIDHLCSLKGVGTWTAEMIMIFTFLRPDIFPILDLGAVRGVEKLYNAGNRMEKDEVLALSETWAPYRSVATWFLWRCQDPEPTEY